MENAYKILVIVDNSFDADIRVQNEVEILTNANFDITVLCFKFDEENVKEYSNIEVKRVPIKRKIKNLMFFFHVWTPFYMNFWSRRIRKELESSSYDLVYTHDLYMIKSVQKARRRSNATIPFIADLHEHYPAAIESYSWTKGFIKRQLTRPWVWYKREKQHLIYPDLCITLSDAFAERLSKLTNRNRDDFFSFPNITPLSELVDFEPDLPFEEGDIVFLYYGAIAERRGIFDLFEAFKEVVNFHDNAKLLLIGPVDKADQPRFFEKINSNQLVKNTHFIPWIESKFWRNYAEKSDFCLAPFHVNPQHNSGVANKLFQYLQAGKFIIASNCTPQKRLIQQYDCGIVYQNQQEFTQALTDCITNIETFQHKGLNAALKFKELNLPEKKANSYVERIKKLVVYFSQRKD